MVKPPSKSSSSASTAQSKTPILADNSKIKTSHKAPHTAGSSKTNEKSKVETVKEKVQEKVHDVVHYHNQATSDGVKRSNTSATMPRPGINRRTTVETRYINMLLSLDNIPRLHNILASLFTWLILAGYIVFPATFTSIRKNERLAEQAKNGSGIEREVLGRVRNAPLLWIAAFACGIGAAGCVGLWAKHRGNYVWLLNRVFLPSFMNALAGLISTLINVYSAQNGTFSITAKVTLVVTSACAAVTAGLFLLYNNWMLKRVKRKHHRERGEDGSDLIEDGLGVSKKGEDVMEQENGQRPKR